MNIKQLLCLSIALVLSSCTSPSQSEKELREALNATLILDFIDSVLHKDSTIDFNLFREKHDFLSVVYLQNGCLPCYPKFVEWHKKMAEMGDIANYSILFVLQTDSYNDFMLNVQELGEAIDEKYYIIIDPDHQFVINNSQIPDWVLNSSMLIDSENKIKMVGAPWVNKDMKNLFFKTVSNEQ